MNKQMPQQFSVYPNLHPNGMAFCFTHTDTFQVVSNFYFFFIYLFIYLIYLFYLSLIFNVSCQLDSEILPIEMLNKKTVS